MANRYAFQPTEAPVTAAIPARALYPVKEARQIWGGMAHSTFYKLLAERKIRLVRLGRRVYVPADEIARIARGEAA